MKSSDFGCGCWVQYLSVKKPMNLMVGDIVDCGGGTVGPVAAITEKHWFDFLVEIEEGKGWEPNDELCKEFGLSKGKRYFGCGYEALYGWDAKIFIAGGYGVE